MKDKEIEDLIKRERERQAKVVDLIASENIVSADVLSALGSELTNKYTEGYPGRRYYGGNEIMDEVELLCQKRALQLFKLSPKKWAVNVQALSGSPANLAVYSALVPIGGKIMGMKLSSGGHLTHGYPLSMTGKLWKSVQYEVDPKTEVIDYKKLEELAMAEKPNLFQRQFHSRPGLIRRHLDSDADHRPADDCSDPSHASGAVRAHQQGNRCPTQPVRAHGNRQGSR